MKIIFDVMLVFLLYEVVIFKVCFVKCFVFGVVGFVLFF